MTINISIKRGQNGNLSAILVDEYGYKCTLFEFDYRRFGPKDGRWLFWFFGDNPSRSFKVPKEDFPMQYFKDACRARYFFGGDVLPDDVNITHGEELLK